MTPNSSLTSYLDPADFLLRCDVTSIFQFCSDGGSTFPQQQQPSVSQMKTALLDPTTPQGAVLAAELSDASGMLESAIFRSARYATADLVALLSLGGNSAAYLKKILTALTIYGLVCRRPGPTPPDTVINSYTEAIKALNDLSEGIRIFAFAEVEQAGLPQTNQFTAWDLSNNNMITQRWSSMFGSRQINKRYFPNTRNFQ